MAHFFLISAVPSDMQIALSEMFHESKNIQNRAFNSLLFLNCSIDWVNAVRIQRYFQSFDLILIPKSVLISILKYNTFSKETENNHHHHYKAKRHPEKYVTIILNGMVNSITHLPRERRISKEHANVSRLNAASSSEVKSRPYVSLVRPKLEYASSAWDPHTKRNIDEIEMVPCRAARFVWNDYLRYSGVSSMIKKLGVGHVRAA